MTPGHATQPAPPAEPTVEADSIPFNRAPSVGTEATYLAQAIANGHLAADGPFTRAASQWISEQVNAHMTLLVHSCTAALELSVLLHGIGPGDEVVMPSYTFTSTANAVAIAGATPVFVDVRPDTFNIDVDAAAAAVSPRTKAIMPVHYAGVGCDMDRLSQLAQSHDLPIIEDAAQGMMASWRGRALGSLGSLGALSFHETKNVTCGEGGALIINDPALAERAEILREKGTDRSRFFRGQVDKYTWVDIGSSHAMSDLAASFLFAQLEHAQEITDARLSVWDRYHAAFADLEAGERLVRPFIPESCEHNAHMYYVVVKSQDVRARLIQHLRERHILAVFHYVPLDASPMGNRVGRVVGDLQATQMAGERLLRLPLWPDMSDAQVQRVIDSVHDFYA